MNKKVHINEKFLIMIDSQIKKFAKKNRLKLTKNSQDWPERSLRWKDNGLDKLLQIYLKSESEDVFIIWGAVTKDKSSRRYWYKLDPQEQFVPLNWGEIEKIFLVQKMRLDEVKESDLEPAYQQ